MISIRKNRIDNGVIGIWHQTGSIPVGFTELTSFQCKHIRGVPDACTNPDVCVGVATHVHTTFAGHTHTLSVTTFSHTHSVGTGGPSQTSPSSAAPSLLASSTHSHSFGSTSVCPALTTAANSTHSHTATSNCPAHITTRFIEKTGIISIRKKTVPRNVSFIWDDTLADIPSNYSKESALLTKFIRGSATIGTTAGSNSHAETSQAAHNHTVTIASHGHTVDATSSLANTFVTSIGGAGSFGFVCDHTHARSTVAITTSGDCGPSASDGAHIHPSISSEPAFREVMFITKSIISVRQKGLQPKIIALWRGTLASIPSTYSNNTSFFAKHVKGVATLCTATGSIGGCDSHQHASDGAHTHTSTISHSHTASGGTGSTGTASSRAAGGGAGVHTHVAAGTTSSSNATPTLTSTGAHQHASANIIPSSKTVAFIKKL